jgi:hypothetical protein
MRSARDDEPILGSAVAWEAAATVHNAAARLGVAVKLRRASADDTVHGDNDKWLGVPSHLLARLRGSSSTAKWRRRREATAAEALGFRWSATV